MNKISKKILAIVTMAAFVVTMMPFAAFAAGNTNQYKPDNSYVLTAGKNVEVDAGTPTVVNFEIKDANRETVGKPAGDGQGTMDTFFWASKVDADGNVIEKVTNDVVFYDVDPSTGTIKDPISTENNRVGVLNNGYVFKAGNMYDGQKIAVAFNDAGTYKIHAGATLKGAESGFATVESVDDLLKLKTVDRQDTIVVDAQDQEVAAVKFNAIDTNKGDYAFTPDVATEKADTLTANMDNQFAVNGMATAKVTATVYSDAGATKPVAAGEKFTLKTQNGLNLSTNEVTTDRNGKIEFTFTMDKARDYKVYLENADLKIQLNINRAAVAEAQDIVTSVDNAQVLEAETNPNTNFADAVQFTITDKDGAEMDGILGEPAEVVLDSETDVDTDYVNIINKPAKSDLKDSEIGLVWDDTNKVYTLAYVGGEPADDLIAGEYTVEIGLESGEKAQATFTTAEFGDVTGINVKMVGKAAGKLADSVVAGETVYGGVYVVDENGIEKSASGEGVSLSLSAIGRAVEGFSTTSNLDGHDFTFNVENSNDIVGTLIKVKAFDQDNGKFAQAELTVVDGLTEYTLAFDSENGQAAKDNKVVVTVVDEDGNVVDVDGATAYAYVDSQSVEDANIDVTETATVNNGKATLTLYSDVETTADIVVAVVDPVADDNNVIYADTLSYTFGEEVVDADMSVVMTIGSSDIVVNNDVVTTDAAPFVDSNWRTMVPVRALMQSFGGSAEWDGDARTVTVENGDTTIVFTADSDKYTVNGEEKTMDTALTIIDGRTYVPVKFVAEELGYEVTALKDTATGLTASVVFQK